MTDFEPILTDAEYEIKEKMVANYEARLMEISLEMHQKLDDIDSQKKEIEKKYEPILTNLKAGLYRHKAASHDYWLNSEITPMEENFDGQELEIMSDGEGNWKILSGRKGGSWQAEVTSLHDLISAAATDPQWEEFLLPNTTKLNARARKDKRAMFIPGCVPVRKEK